ncbi:MAG: hypothetical protein ACRDJC_11330, partial [Thermomicrobiales bacterium]
MQTPPVPVTTTRMDDETLPSRNRRWRVSRGQAGLYGLLGVAALVAIFPVFWLLTGSLQTLPELYEGRHILPAHPQWQNYVDAW